jgi:hypothetical protein
MLKCFKKIMGLLDQTKQKDNIIDNNEVKISLSQVELEILLRTIKSSSFKGEAIEILYNLVLKLQNHYLSFPVNNFLNNK